MRTQIFSYPSSLIIFLLFCATVHISAEPTQPTKINLKKNSFILLQSSFIHKGFICRKIDRIHSPWPAAWFIKPAFNSIYLINPQKFSFEKEIHFSHCQTIIQQKSILGPFSPGDWMVYAARNSQLIQVYSYEGREKLLSQKQNYNFTISKAAVLKVEASLKGNQSGACIEYIPALLSSLQENKDPIKKIKLLLPQKLIEKELGQTSCRAQPRTLANGAILLESGSYQLPAEAIHSAEIFYLE